jgi:N-acetylglucosaminyl-diphospho-decaprenol L-rhamnosyltransferase
MTDGPSMHGARDVTVVVTTHNARATLPATAACIRNLRGVAKVVVVDSGSADGTPELAASLFPGARIEALASNVGPCVTRNIGLAAAETARVLFVDDDMGFEPDIVERLSAELDAHPDCVAAGPTIVFDDRPDAIQYAGGRMHFGGLPHLYSLGEKPDPAAKSRRVDVLTAGCLLVSRTAALDVGGFDERFFYLAEDVDFALRLRHRGHQLLLVAGVVVRNVGGSAALSLKDAEYPARRVELHSRNRWMLIGRDFDRWTIFALLPALLLYEAAWAAFATITGHLVPYLRGKARAVGALREKSVLRRRRKVVSDRKLIGAPKMTFTRTALAQGGADAGAVALDGSLRLMWTCLRGLVQ